MVTLHRITLVSLVLAVLVFGLFNGLAQETTPETETLSLLSSLHGQTCENNFRYLAPPFNPTMEDVGIFFNQGFGGTWTAETEMRVTFIAGGDARIGEYRGFDQMHNFVELVQDGVTLEASGDDESLTYEFEAGDTFEIRIGSVYDPEMEVADQVTLTVICQPLDEE